MQRFVTPNATIVTKKSIGWHTVTAYASAIEAQESSTLRTMTAESPTQPKSLGVGPWHKNIRLYSGLVLFAFVTGHLINHSVGLVSLEAMETVRDYRTLIWRNPLGTTLLLGSLLSHLFLALYKFVRRRSWRMSPWEAVQLAFGFLIPALLIPHIIFTRTAKEAFGIQDDYAYVMTAIWPDGALNQSILLLLVWIHGCIGIHFWLRSKSWYPRISWFLYTLVVLLPVLSLSGFVVASRRMFAAGLMEYELTMEQAQWLAGVRDNAVTGIILIIAAALAFRIARAFYDRFGPTVKITYANGQTVVNQIGPTLLEISRAHGVPHASVCGGRARCSTCRVRILEGMESLPEPSEQEQRVLKRVGAGSNVRLACQLVPNQAISVATLLPAQQTAPSDEAASDKYLWGVDQTVTIMFADIRGFTSLSENKLPYDVVFVLNQYLGQMSDAIAESGGYVDKFLGDGIMALFGMEKSVEQGARDALSAARAMHEVLNALNVSLAPDLDKPLNIGIGIHTGPAILGRIGVKGASGAAQRITALGDTVNTASRLESSCKDLRSQLIVSETTIAESGLSVSGGTHELIAVKGREKKVPIVAFAQASDLMLGIAPESIKN